MEILLFHRTPSSSVATAGKCKCPSTSPFCRCAELYIKKNSKRLHPSGSSANANVSDECVHFVLLLCHSVNPLHFLHITSDDELMHGTHTGCRTAAAAAENAGSLAVTSSPLEAASPSTGAAGRAEAEADVMWERDSAQTTPDEVPH